MTATPAGVGLVVLSLLAVGGVFTGAVATFVLRVEHAAWARRVEQLERDVRELLGRV